MSAIQTARYTVQAGDTLSAIARRYGVSVSAIATANGIKNVDLIRVGQVLTLPDVSPKADTAAASFGVLRSNANPVPTVPAKPATRPAVVDAGKHVIADAMHAQQAPAWLDRARAFITAHKWPLALAVAGALGAAWWVNSEPAK